MPRDTLNAQLDWASTEDNTIDKPTRLITWDVPDGSVVRLTSGSSVVASFTTTSGNSGPAGASSNPSRSSELALAYVEPNTPLDAPVPFAVFGVTAFNQLSLKEQQSRENAQARTLQFLSEVAPGGEITFADADEIVLMANSPDVIDGSAITFEYPMEERNE